MIKLSLAQENLLKPLEDRIKNLEEEIENIERVLEAWIDFLVDDKLNFWCTQFRIHKAMYPCFVSGFRSANR